MTVLHSFLMLLGTYNMFKLKKIFFAQNTMKSTIVEPPDPDPGDPNPPIINPCAVATDVHPRWKESSNGLTYGVDWFGFAMHVIPPPLLPHIEYPHGLGSFGSFMTRDWIILADDPVIGEVAIMKYLYVWWLTNGFMMEWTKDPSANIEPTNYYPEAIFLVRLVRDLNLDNNEDKDPDGQTYTSDYEDASGNKYNAVKIGNKIWLTKNLYTTKYIDNTDIPKDISDPDNGCYFIPPHGDFSGINSDQDMREKYGCQYNMRTLKEGLVDTTGDYQVSLSTDWEDMVSHLINTYSTNGNIINDFNVMGIIKSCRQVNHPLDI